ncbi:hypothetical protein AnigIFM59636_002148 [Aspergillus niger]|nr:hypothetical protein AnigIFM49718_006225 [Aspergillus niger]GKZ98125.1 hypothetical protein AnigIFM59636_002148 [Aspergillus niger]
MLGRLRMSLVDAEQAYLEMSEKIFNPKRHRINAAGQIYDFLKANGKFDAKALEQAIQSIIQEKAKLPVDSLLQEPDAQCKVFVAATRVSNSELVTLRSYGSDLPETLFNECKIWEAARATSAAPTFFDPVEIGPFRQQFIDGGLLYNNPITLLYTEAADLWPDRISNAIFLSIGTGSAPGGAFQGNLKNIVEEMQEMVTQTEKSHEDFCRNHKRIVQDRRIFRFQVCHGLADVGLAEYKDIPKIADSTETYLGLIESQGKTSDFIAYCTNSFGKYGCWDSYSSRSIVQMSDSLVLRAVRNALKREEERPERSISPRESLHNAISQLAL